MKKTVTMQEEDLRTFSHDIKSLITSIYSYNQILQKHLVKTGDTNSLKFSMLIQNQIKKLTEMVEKFTYKK